MIPVLLLLLAVAAVYVGTIETAFSTLMRLSLRLMAERGGRDDRLGFYFDDPIRLFVPARLILGIIFSLATMSIAILTGRTGSLRSIGMLMLFVAVFILICEHVVPMFIVRRDPERVLEVLLPPFDVAARFVQPLTNVLVRLIVDGRRDRQATAAAAAGNGEPAEEREPATDPDDAPGEKGLMERDERKLLQSIVEFGDTLVREVMTPRPDIVAISEPATLGQLRALFREQEYSRIPVFKDNLDNILGIVFVKDLMRIADAAPDDTPLQSLLRPATFVPETKRVADLLKEFQRKQVQLAIVVDEYGGTAGLVTLEDLLEEIVGEIRDEYDVETEPVVDEGNGSFVFSGKASFDEVRERLRVEIEPEGFETVGGYVLTRVGRVPMPGESFEIDGMNVEVLEAERRRIHRVRMRRAAAVAPVEPTSRTESRVSREAS
jgi:putative hemolysin